MSKIIFTQRGDTLFVKTEGADTRFTSVKLKYSVMQGDLTHSVQDQVTANTVINAFGDAPWGVTLNGPGGILVLNGNTNQAIGPFAEEVALLKLSEPRELLDVPAQEVSNEKANIYQGAVEFSNQPSPGPEPSPEPEPEPESSPESEVLGVDGFGVRVVNSAAIGGNMNVVTTTVRGQHNTTNVAADGSGGDRGADDSVGYGTNLRNGTASHAGSIAKSSGDSGSNNATGATTNADKK